MFGLYLFKAIMTYRYKIHHRIPLLILLLFTTTLIFGDDTYIIRGDQILEKMFKKIETIKTMTYRLEKKERIKNKIIEEALFIKLSIEPFKVYSKMDFPKEGLEVLYDADWEKKKAIINTNSFPWVNVRFSPTGKTMRKDQHHTILDSGYKKITSSIQFEYQDYLKKGLEMTEYKGEALIDDKKCWVLEFTNPRFSLTNYTVNEGEHLTTIANKFKLSDYMILENNKEVRFYDDIEAGQHIKIPTSYSKKMILYIDQSALIPLKVEVCDTKGLYEEFTFRNVQLNVVFKENEFSEDYEEYGF